MGNTTNPTWLTVLDLVLKTIPAIISVIAIFVTIGLNRRILSEKKFEEERKEINKKLNSFYGPILHLRGVSRNLWELLKFNAPKDFSLLQKLLEGHVFSAEDNMLIDKILEISEQVNTLVQTSGGLIDDPKLRELLAKAGSHNEIITAARSGNLKNNLERFRESKFPHELEGLLNAESERLKKRLEYLNSTAT
jgi:hypothetical protein